MSTTTEEFEGPRESRFDRRMIAVVGALVVVVLGALWFLALRDGSPEAESAAPPATQEALTPAPEPAPKNDRPATRPGGGGPVETFQVFAPRDPFEPLVSPETGGEAADTGATVDTGGGVITNSNGNGGDVSGGVADSGGSTVGGHTVSVIDVFSARGSRRAQVEVDGTVYKVREGETFADNFKLISASGECANMLFGDDQFTLCEGEQILK
jgi:hypothetical protein